MRAALAVLRKELVDNARDRRTLFSAFVFGPLFGPALFAVLVNVLVSQTVSSVEEPFDVPIVGVEQAPNLIEFLYARGIRKTESSGIETFEQAASAVEDGREDLVVMIAPDFADSFRREGLGRVGLVYDRSNTSAGSRVQRVRAAIATYSQQLGALRLLARGIEPGAQATIMLDEFDVSTAAGRSVVLLGMLTYFLLFATLMGGFYLAIDSTAGERERRSLEPLLTTPVERSSLLLGKMAATMCYMLLSLVLTLAGFTVALHFVSLEALGMSSGFDARAAATAFAVLLPFVPLGAALMTLVASFTKSYKEAQTYLTLVLLVPTLPLVFATMLNVKASAALMWIPSLSQHLLITALIRQDPLPPVYFAQSAAATLVVGLVLGWIAAKLYERESLLG